jgi:Family of unknown function (DUF6220)
MSRGRGVQRVLAQVFLAGIAVQFFLAGLGVFRAKPKGHDKLFESSAFDAHRVVGDAMMLIALVILIVALVSREQVRISVLLFVLMAVQFLLAGAGSVPALAALHPVNGLVLIGVAQFLVRTPTPQQAPAAAP